MTIFWITGGGGFIGRHLARAIARPGRHIGVVGNGASPVGADGCVVGPIGAESLDRLASHTGPPDIVYHLAGGSSVGASLTDPRRDRQRTVGSTVALLDWLVANAPSACLVAASSAAVYGEGHAGLIPTGATLNPFSPYAAHKAEMEALCVRSGLASSIVRLFSVYGPGLRKQLLWDICNRLASGAEELVLGGTGQECRDWTYIDDVTRFLEATPALCRRGGVVLNAGTGAGTTVSTIAESVVQAWSDRAVPVRFDGVRRAGDPFSLIAGPEGLERQTWQTPLEQGVASYVGWFRDQFAGS